MSEMFEGSHARSENARCQKHGNGKKFGRILGADGHYFDAPLKTPKNPNACFLRVSTTSRLDIDAIHEKIDAENRMTQIEPRKKNFSGHNARLRKLRKSLGR